MSKVKQALATARRLVVGETVAEQIARRRLESLESWRRLVAAAAAGKQVDADEVAMAASHLGIAPTVLSRTFDGDVLAWHEQADLAKTAAAQAANAEESERKSKAAAELLEEARATLARLEQEAAAAPWAAMGSGIAESYALRHRREHPRLWDDARLLDARAAEEAIAVSDPDEQIESREPVAAGSARLDDAFWEDD